jgi:hypothetical protein
MYAVIRRYEGADEEGLDELARRVNAEFAPRLAELEGFHAYFVLRGEGGVIASIGLFDTEESAVRSSRLSGEWIRDAGLGSVLPNPPEVTAGEVIVERLAGERVTQ